MLFFSVFSGPGHEIHPRRLTDPSSRGEVKDLYWRPDAGLWGYFNSRPQLRSGHRVWYCWFGTKLGAPNQALTASVEINLAIDPIRRAIGGRSLMGENGRLYLGHKGMLGGGRGGQLSMAEFGQRIRGFVREPVLVGEKQENVFVIGAPGERDFLERLRTFVLECERLRVFAKTRSEGATGASVRSTEKKRTVEFTPEHDVDGTGSGRPADPITIRRVHGRIVNALQRKIGSQAVNGSQFDMRPDLYIQGKDGRMETLFEVKASSDTQSWFTALGQLVVNAAPQKRARKRVLVCPTPRADPSFEDALSLLGVDVVTFTEEDNGTISFTGLERVLARKQRRRST